VDERYVYIPFLNYFYPSKFHLQCKYIERAGVYVQFRRILRDQRRPGQLQRVGISLVHSDWVPGGHHRSRHRACLHRLDLPADEANSTGETKGSARRGFGHDAGVVFLAPVAREVLVETRPRSL